MRAINQIQYLNELKKLLSFMSSWDRKATLEQYQAMFDAAEDPEALMEQLGSPTKLAIRLAGHYVPSAAPGAVPTGEAEAQPEPEQTEYKMEEFQEQLALEPEAEPEREAPAAVRRRVKSGALAAYLVPAVILGLPITAVALCIGIPILTLGAGTAACTIWAVLQAVDGLKLLSDILMTAGAGLVLCGLGLLLTWLGAWISIELAYLWIAKVLVPLGRRLCVKTEEVAR